MAETETDAARGLRAAAGGQPQGLGGCAHGACMLPQVQPGGRERHGLADPKTRRPADPQTLTIVTLHAGVVTRVDRKISR